MLKLSIQSRYCPWILVLYTPGLLSISTWVPTSHLRFNMANTKLLIFAPKPITVIVCSISSNQWLLPVLQVIKPPHPSSTPHVPFESWLSLISLEFASRTGLLHPVDCYDRDPCHTFIISCMDYCIRFLTGLRFSISLDTLLHRNMIFHVNKQWWQYNFSCQIKVKYVHFLESHM